MRILLTGGTGFIGSHFINGALAEGHELFCIRRPGSMPRITLHRQPKWLDGDLRDDWTDILKTCDVFMHLASHSTNTPYDSLESCIYWNVIVSLQLAEQARLSEIKNYIIAGTGFEYGRSGERFKEIPTDAPLEPTQTYPASKAMASIAFRQWATQYQLKLRYLRIFQVYGDGEDPKRLWPSLRTAALSGADFDLTPAEQVRDFTPVSHVVKSLLNALHFPKGLAGYPSIEHIGTGVATTLREFSQTQWKAWDARGELRIGTLPYREGEVMRYVPKISENPGF